MKSHLMLLLVAVLGTSCQKEAITASPQVQSANPLAKALLAQLPSNTMVKNVSPVDLNQLAVSKEATKFTVSLQTAQEQPLKQGDALKPNTTYRVVVQGESSARFVLKMAEGFEIVQSPAATAGLNAVYLIRTTENVAPQLYLSVVPLHEEKNVLTKERPTGFLLPN